MPDKAVTGACCLHGLSLLTTTPGMVFPIELPDVKTRSTVSHCPHALAFAFWLSCGVSTHLFVNNVESQRHPRRDYADKGFLYTCNKTEEGVKDSAQVSRV